MRSDLALIALLALPACPGTIDDPRLFGAGPVDCVAFVDDYVTRTCGASCHSANRHEADLDLETRPIADRLIGVPGAQAGCDVHPLADAGTPEASLIYLKLGEQPPCGERMPLLGKTLSGAELDCVLEWIADLPGN
jgi:hypothetical protein